MTHFKHRLFADTETRSHVDLKTRGAYLYAEDSEPIMWQYALDDGEVQIWEPLAKPKMPVELREYLADPSVELVFHNAEFDRVNMLGWGLDKEFDLNAERFLCTMTWAKMCRLPGGLEELCRVLGVPEAYAKKKGDLLIKMFCVPKSGRFTAPEERPAEWAEFVEYGKFDIVAMRECAKRMPDVFTPRERRLYALTMDMNARGLKVDRELAATALHQSDEIKARYKKEGRALTGVADFNVGSQKAVLAFLSEYGVKLDDCRADTLEKFLDSAQAGLLPANVVGLLSTRLKANKASVAKYSAVLKGTGSDGRIRGLINHYAAGTGRDGGRRFQPQNLARPVLLNDKFTMDDAVAVVKGGLAEIRFEEPLQLLSDTVRGVLIPETGRKFCVADLASIEGRILPWMMGEDWKTQYFRDLDAGLVKYDGYKLAYATAFGVDPSTVTREQRTLGKPVDLATGFGGGVGALITFAAVYGIDLDDMARKAHGAADPYLWQECDKSYDWFLKMKLTMDLDRFTWTGCQYIVKAWRIKHPAIVAGWARIEGAFRNALHNPGQWFEACRGTHMMNNGGWIFLTLPSQRMLVYPHVHEVERNGRKQLAYMGVNPFSHKWGSIYTYGGKLCIAEGELVLTERGWVPIETVAPGDKVWDGVEWVRTDGAICNGEKEVIEAYGARMTHDHEVLTEEGWKHASQSERHSRAACRLPDGVVVPWQRQEEFPVGGCLRLRQEGNPAGFGAEEAAQAGGATGQDGRTAGRVTKVYDLMNCGPRHRFVIAAGGAPLIVHNCENIDQAIARDVLFDHLPAVEAAGYPVNMRVHDELITEPLDTPDFSGERLARIIATPHSWCADLPLNAEGADLTRYQK